MKRRIVIFAAIVQSILVLRICWFTKPGSRFGARRWIAPDGAAVVIAVLAISFVPRRCSHTVLSTPVRFVYRLASIWLGVFNFLFIAACLSWIAYAVVYIARLRISGHAIAGTLFGLAILASLYGIVNAADIRVRRVTVKLPGLPASWRGRVAALVTDTHLGHIKGSRFLTGLVGMLRQLKATSSSSAATCSTAQKLTRPAWFPHGSS